MSDFVHFSTQEMSRDLLQTVMQAKQMARSLENFVDTLIPLLDNGDVAKQLEEVRENAAKASGVLQRLYNRNARETYGSSPQVPQKPALAIPENEKPPNES